MRHTSVIHFGFRLFGTVAIAALFTACGGSETLELETSSDSLRAAPCGALLDTHWPVSNVESAQVTNDTHVFASIGTVAVEVTAPNLDTSWGAGVGKTCLGVYDAGYTSDPSSGGTRQLGAIGGAPSFASSTEATVAINTDALAAGTYWLRFITRLADGSWEVAEGILMVH